MKTTHYLLYVLLVFVVSYKASAAQHVITDAKALATACDRTSPKFMICVGYFTAISEEIRNNSNSSHTNTEYCLPTSVQIGEVIDSFTRYLSLHPEKSGRSARLVVMETLTLNFPCEK